MEGEWWDGMVGCQFGYNITSHLVPFSCLLPLKLMLKSQEWVHLDYSVSVPPLYHLFTAFVLPLYRLCTAFVLPLYCLCIAFGTPLKHLWNTFGTPLYCLVSQFISQLISVHTSQLISLLVSQLMIYFDILVTKSAAMQMMLKFTFGPPETNLNTKLQKLVCCFKRKKFLSLISFSISGDKESLLAAGFNSSYPIKITIHGFSDKGVTSWCDVSIIGLSIFPTYS